MYCTPVACRKKEKTFDSYEYNTETFVNRYEYIVLYTFTTRDEMVSVNG